MAVVRASFGLQICSRLGISSWRCLRIGSFRIPSDTQPPGMGSTLPTHDFKWFSHTVFIVVCVGSHILLLEWFSLSQVARPFMFIMAGQWWNQETRSVLVFFRLGSSAPSSAEFVRWWIKWKIWLVAHIAAGSPVFVLWEILCLL